MWLENGRRIFTARARREWRWRKEDTSLRRKSWESFEVATTRKTVGQLSSAFRPSSPRFTPPSHRALSGLCSEVVSVIVNTFFVASPLIARQDQEIASPVVNLVIGGLNATRSLVLGPQEVILILTNSYVDEQSKWHFCYKPLCDLDNLFCQGLVQDSENYEFESLGESGNYESDVPQVSVSGKLIQSIAFRHSIGALYFILSVIRDGYRIPFISTPPPHHYKDNSTALEEPGFVVEAISELLCDNRVKEIFNFPDIASQLSVSVQDNGKKRYILDLKLINLHIFRERFKCKCTLHLVIPQWYHKNWYEYCYYFYYVRCRYVDF